MSNHRLGCSPERLSHTKPCHIITIQGKTECWLIWLLHVGRFLSCTHYIFAYCSFEDKTVAGVWRRAEATAATPAPFSKIILSKLLILPTTKAREDYFKQQSTFVTREGRDEFTEFSTSIQGACALVDADRFYLDHHGHSYTDSSLRSQ